MQTTKPSTSQGPYLRPLATLPYPSPLSQPQLVAFLSGYSLSMIKNIENYLCSGVKIEGYDFQSPVKTLPQIKGKAIYVDGKGTDSGVGYEVMKHFQVISWSVTVALPLLAAGKEEAKSIRNNLNENLIIFSGGSPINQNKISLEKLHQSKVHYISNCPSTQSSCKIFVNTLPVCLLLPRLEHYEISKIIEIIADDLTNAILIMLSSGMMIRVIKKHEQFPIQNFYTNENQKDAQFDKLVTSLKGKKSVQDMQIEKLRERMKEGEPKQNDQKIADKHIENVATNSNKSLIFLFLGLLVLCGVYFSMKLSGTSIG